MAFPACAALYFVNLRGDVLLERRYRDDTGREAAETFRTHILNNKALKDSSPVQTLGKFTYMFMRHSDLYVLCLTRGNANVMMAFKFMSSLLELFGYYFGGEVKEKSILNNFVLMYELLDEVMDHGFPQITDPTILKSLVTQKGFSADLPGFAVEIMKASQKSKKEEPAPNATLTVTGAVGWRRDGIRYKKNELYLDIVEQVNLLMGANGAELRSDVMGKVVVKAYLSDMPELRLGLNDIAQDATFHQCVNLGIYEANKEITFVPPDGEFELMRYRCQDNIRQPFKILSVLHDLGRTKMECTVTVRSLFDTKLSATSVLLLVPVPDQTSKASITVSTGKAKYDATKKALVWKIGKFVGGVEQSLQAEVLIMAATRQDAKPWSRPPISMQFQVPMFSASGLNVSYLQILERKWGMSYKVDKWVRQSCRSGEFLQRMSVLDPLGP